MSDSTTQGPFDPEPEAELPGLSLSELLGEVWVPAAERDATISNAAVTDPDPGDASTWNP
jgi:hypothetical protein